MSFVEWVISILFSQIFLKFIISYFSVGLLTLIQLHCQLICSSWFWIKLNTLDKLLYPAWSNMTDGLICKIVRYQYRADRPDGFHRIRINVMTCGEALNTLWSERRVHALLRNVHIKICGSKQRFSNVASWSPGGGANNKPENSSKNYCNLMLFWLRLFAVNWSLVCSTNGFVG